MRVKEKLHTNAEVSPKERHSTSLAQLISELLTARVMNATGQRKLAPSVTMVNSQISRAAMTLVPEKLLILYAIKLPRSAIHAKKVVIQNAIPLPSAKPLVVSLTPNVIQVQVNAMYAIQQLTRTAPKLKKHATKNVDHNLYQSATKLLENAKCAIRKAQAAYQIQLVRILAK